MVRLITAQRKIRKTCSELANDFLNFQHDPLTCAVALGWCGVTIEDLPLAFEVRDGLLVESVDPAGKSTRLVTRVDGAGFDEFWLRMVTRQHVD
jgi:hypothetical protein